MKRRGEVAERGRPSGSGICTWSVRVCPFSLLSFASSSSSLSPKRTTTISPTPPDGLYKYQTIDRTPLLIPVTAIKLIHDSSKPRPPRLHLQLPTGRRLIRPSHSPPHCKRFKASDRGTCEIKSCIERRPFIFIFVKPSTSAIHAWRFELIIRDGQTQPLLRPQPQVQTRC